MRAQKRPTSDKSADARLQAFLAEYSAPVRAVAEAALKNVRQRLPGAVELVYDNYNALAIAFSPTERRADIVLSVTLYPRWVSLFFTRGVDLPDSKKLLKGSGKTIRHVVLEDAAAVNSAEIDALITHAIQMAPAPLTRSAKRRAIIKMALAKKRPRRP
jgi:hypothetical protein